MGRWWIESLRVHVPFRSFWLAQILPVAVCEMSIIIGVRGLMPLIHDLMVLYRQEPFGINVWRCINNHVEATKSIERRVPEHTHTVSHSHLFSTLCSATQSNKLGQPAPQGATFAVVLRSLLVSRTSDLPRSQLGREEKTRSRLGPATCWSPCMGDPVHPADPHRIQSSGSTSREILC